MAFAQTTPMRPVPGAFLNTPAMASRFQGREATSRRLFQQPTAENNQIATREVANAGNDGGNPGAVLVAAPQDALPPIAKAARQVNTFLQQDESFPELDSYTQQNLSSEYDIPSSGASETPFQNTHMYPIPNAVFEHYNAGQFQMLMGLFAEINHAWVVIDNSLFLWDYTNPEPELVGFEEQPQAIHAVALLPPKPGVFVNTITHILAVATTNDIILLGVSAEATVAGTKTVSLYQTKLVVPVRGIDVRAITGTANGRIFFGNSGDVDVYELYYQMEEKWFSGRCGKINHSNRAWSQVASIQSTFWGQGSQEHIVDMIVDDSRSLLYTLSSKSTIRTYFMEAPDKLREVIEKSWKSCLDNISHITRRPSRLLADGVSIVSISPIAKQEASKLNLMALTNTGCRLFFSATSASSYMYNPPQNSAPQSMIVLFVKLPPSRNERPGAAGDAALDLDSDTLSRSRKGVRFPPGYFVDIVRKEDNGSDFIFASAPDAGRIKNTSLEPNVPMKFHEHAAWIDIGSQAEAIGLVTKPFAAATQPAGFGNELAVQFDESPSEFAVLTNTGIHIIRRRRFVDIFASVLRDAQGDEGYNQLCRRLVAQYGRVETVSAALAVACGHGGDARPGAARAADQVTEDRARSCFVDFGGQPTITETDSILTMDQVRMSSRHDALALYLARLVRQLWKIKVIAVGASPAGTLAIVSTIPLAKLNAVQEHVERLRRFLHSNRGLIQGLSGPSDLAKVDTMQEEVALKAEHQALHALQKLMESISEGISFSLMLFDERVVDIYTRLDANAQQGFQQLTYEKLFSQEDGKDLAKTLVKAIVNRNIESGSNVETVADALRRRCGSFCSSDDVVIFKAQEQLKRAADIGANSNASRSLLHESLRLFERVAGSLTPANLEAAVNGFLELRYYAGALQLCLSVAREKDRGNTALSWVNDGKPAGDPRANAHAERKRCYDMIHSILDNLDTASSAEPEIIDGNRTLMGMKKVEAYAVVNESDDEVFHFDLYEWYIGRGWTDRILSIDSPHVVAFLQRLAGTDVEHADLLCRFYTHHAQYFKAAEVQAGLADSDFALGIKDRIRLLGRAKTNASVNTVGVSPQQRQMLSQDATERLDIGNIQDDLLERLLQDDRLDQDRKQEVEEHLDGKILEISELYNTYADQAGYYDLCLLIFFAADYRNTTTITSCWNSLIESTHEEAMAAAELAEANGSSLPPMPYEVLVSKIRNIGHRTAMNDRVFPVATLLPELCRYATANGQDGSHGADPSWPVRVFLSLDVPFDTITRILQRLLISQDYGFSGNARFRVVELVVFTLDQWFADVRRRGGASRTSGISSSVGELLDKCREAVHGHSRRDASEDLRILGVDVARLTREYNTLSPGLGMGSEFR